MPNHLQFENSPYLLQHADNPVDWYPWGEAALKRARLEGKPIFLSIGYAACHWCHVMEHESFEDPETAALMNEHFINIKVDREERPDLDQIYMSAVVAMTGQGGWPMSVFLTPDGKPFYGGTYFPPARRYNMPAFREVLNTIAVLWCDDREKLLNSSEKITEHIQKSQLVNFAQQELRPGAPDEAVMRLSQSYDWDNGGWGKAPKFPQPMILRFLLQRASRGNQLALKMAVHTLTEMSKGGIYDAIGGGFARYSTDDLWLIPHFEKMLYDNAQLARCYLYAYKLTRQMAFRQVCEQTLEFIIREMGIGSEPDVPASQGLYSSLDADSEGEEGKYYIWSFEEIERILEVLPNSASSGKAPTDLNFFKAAYGVTRQGNFEGNTVLQRKLDDNELSKMFDMDPTSINERLNQIHRKLLVHREQRIHPSTDDKVLASWNAMALLTFAESARYLNNDKYLKVSQRIANFILKELYSGERLLRSWRKGIARHNAYLEDYALLILGLLALYQSDAQVIWFRSAVNLAREMLDRFTDPEGGFFDTRDDHEGLLVRPKDLQDNATPSGNAAAAQSLLYLATYDGNEDLRETAITMLESIQQTAVSYPTAFAEWLCAIDFALETIKEVAIIGDPQDLGTRELINHVWALYRPYLLAAISDYPPDNDAPALLKNRSLYKDKPTAYVCERFLCLRPVNTPSELAAMLGDEY